MEVIKLTLGFIQTNTYIINSESNNAIVIDPGFEPDEILNVINKKKLTLKMILLTHGHFDHIGAADILRKQSDAAVYIHANDAEMLADKEKSRGIYHPENEGGNYVIKKGVNMFNDGDTINLDELSVKAVHTPGHTKGSSVFIINDIIFTGDTLFCENVGRTDLYGGDELELMNSLNIFKGFNRDYKIYPGHGNESTLLYELKHNKWLSGQ